MTKKQNKSTPQEIFFNTYLPVDNLSHLVKSELITLCKLFGIDSKGKKEHLIKKLDPYINSRKNINNVILMIENIDSSTWALITAHLSTFLMPADKIQYIFLSTNYKTSTILGFLQYYGDDFSHENVKNLFKIDNRIIILEEITSLFHLPFIQVMLKSIVALEYDYTYENGKFLIETSAITSDIKQYISMSDINNMFHNNEDETVLTIEQVKEDAQISYSECQKVKQFGILKFAMKQQVKMVHFIYPAKVQIYHCFGLQKNPHYGVKRKFVPLLKWILHNLAINYTVYESNNNFHHNEYLVVYNNKLPIYFPVTLIRQQLDQYILKSRNLSNFFLAYGFSGEYIDGNTGAPQLTTSLLKGRQNGKTLLSLVFPLLCFLSTDLKRYFNQVATNMERNNKFSHNLGSNINYHIPPQNIFEGFDISLTLKDDILSPHCDVMNDDRYGYNYVSVIKSDVYDTDGIKMATMSIICYTRKAIGDYMDKYGLQK